MSMSRLPWNKNKGNLEALLGGDFQATVTDKPIQAGSAGDYALRYAALGWPVFPVYEMKEDGGCSCGKPDCSNPGKHPRTAKGFENATTDAEQIRKWWGAWPNANIGVATGERSGIWVLDVDKKHGGLDTRDDLIAKHGQFPDTPMAFTGGGGEHYLFRYQAGIRNRANVLPGIDVRGEGGYIIVEPSNHHAGTDYVWEAEGDPLEGVAPVDAPQWLIDLIGLETERERSTSAPAAGADIPEGGRNAALASLAGSMRRSGIGQEAIEAALQAENTKRCNPPLPASEVSTIAWSVARYAPADDVAALSRVDVSELMAKINGDAPESVEGLEVINAAEWAGQEIEERQWLVDGWMPMRQTTALYARGGTGKTLATQQLMTAVAAGGDWLGMPVRKGPCVGLYCEDDRNELHRRQADINGAMGLGWDDLRDMHIIPRVGHDNLLMHFDSKGIGHLTPFWAELFNVLERVRPVLLVVDTAADTFGGNENIRPQVRQYVQQALTRLASAFDCAVILCAHPSVAGINSGEGTGGSTAWENSVRSRLYMDKDETTHRITLTRKKSNYSAIGDAVDLFWHDGALKTYAEAEALGDLPERISEQKIETDFFTLLDHVHDRQKQKVSNAPNGKNYAPRVFTRLGARMKPAITWSMEQWEAAMDRLLADGRLIVSGDPKRGLNLVREGEQSDA